MYLKLVSYSWWKTFAEVTARVQTWGCRLYLSILPWLNRGLAGWRDRTRRLVLHQYLVSELEREAMMPQMSAKAETIASLSDGGPCTAPGLVRERENVNPVLGQDGTPAMIEGTPVSPQRFAEVARGQVLQALRDSETRYRRLFEAAKDGILILDFKTGQIVDVNPFLIEMLGYTHSEFVGKKLWEIGPFKDIPASRSAFQELQTKKIIRYDDLPLETKDGRRINVEFVSNVYPVDGSQVVQCNIRDITERARTAAALKISEAHHRSVFEGAVHGIYRGTLDGSFLEVNPALVAMLGYSSAEEVLKLNVPEDVFAKPEV